MLKTSRETSNADEKPEVQAWEQVCRLGARLEIVFENAKATHIENVKYLIGAPRHEFIIKMVTEAMRQLEKGELN